MAVVTPSGTGYLPTSQWRIVRSVISSLQVLMVSLGRTVVTGDDMISHTGVSADERPSRITFRA